MDITPKDPTETKAIGLGQRITVALGIVVAQYRTRYSLGCRRLHGHRHHVPYDRSGENSRGIILADRPRSDRQNPK